MFFSFTTVSKKVPIGIFFYFFGLYCVPIYISGSLFSVFWLNSCEECQLSLMCTLLDLSVMSKFLNYYCFMALVLCYTAGKFDFYLCLCVKFHKSSLQVPIFTAEGPYFIKSWVPIGSLLLSLEVPISFRHSVTGLDL